MKKLTRSLRPPPWPTPLEIRYRPRRPLRATAIFLTAVTIAMIPTVASFEFFRWLTFTDVSALVLAAGVGVIFGMLTAAVLV